MSGPSRVLAFVHPVAALAVAGFLAYVASLGLRSRNRADAHLRPRHARLAPYAFGLMAANAAGGALSTWWLRNDVPLGSTAHFRVAIAIVLLLAATAWLSRRVAHQDLARTLHPLLGLIALLLTALQVFFGLGLLPL